MSAEVWTPGVNILVGELITVVLMGALYLGMLIGRELRRGGER